MGLTDLFNQWIVERGSAVVQEKHIALFRDQLSLADKRIVKLELENTNLKQKLTDSESEISQLKKGNEQLKKAIEEHKRPHTKKDHVCPRCHEPNFKLVQNYPHPNPFFARGGFIVRHYKCDKCNYEETKNPS